jgi:polyphosphate kinase
MDFTNFEIIKNPIMAQEFNPRDITWLGFNARVLQEAMDKSVPIHLRI